jgi:hypothetical protein
MAAIIEMSDPIVANKSSLLTMQLVKEDGTGFMPEVVTLTLYEKYTRTILNGKDAVDILSSADASGNLSLGLTPLDNALLNPTDTRQTEVHVALIEWEWNTGANKGEIEIEFVVKGRPYA